MKSSIKCPRCGHKMITRIGIYVKAKFNYNWNSEEVFSERNLSLRDYIPKRRILKYSNKMFEKIQKEKGLLGFFCRHCDEPLPKEMTKEILDYIQKKNILCKFGKKS